MIDTSKPASVPAELGTGVPSAWPTVNENAALEVATDIAGGPVDATGAEDARPESSADQVNVTYFQGLVAFRVLASFGVILLHTDMVWGYHDQLMPLLRLRDASIPFFVLTGSFLLARSVSKRRGDSWAPVVKRARRLLVPLYVWTAVYLIVFNVIQPIMNGKPIAVPEWTVLLSGYFHLWFLQFMFVSSIAVVWISRMSWPSSILLALASGFFCLGASLAGDDPFHFGLFPYVLVGVVLSRWEWAQPPRLVHFTACIGTAAAHLLLQNPLTVLLYALSVFMFALRRMSVPAWIASVADCSYAIYIVHMFAIAVVQVLSHQLMIRPSASAVFMLSIALYGACFAGSLLAKRTRLGALVLP